MKRSELHVQIDLVLEKLIANNKNLSIQPGKFSQLETDMLRKQCIELYDFINQLHMANVLDKPVIQPEIIQQKEFVTMNEGIKVEKNEPEIEIEKKVDFPVIEIKSEPEVRKLEPILKAEFIVADDETKAADSISESNVNLPKPEAISLPIDNLKIEEKPIEATINVKIERTKEETVSELKKQLSHPIFDAPKFVPIAEKEVNSIAPPKKSIQEEKSVLDKISEVKTEKTLHETITIKKLEKELSHGFSNSRISKIKDAIDISKRFEIQTRLFGEDSNAYNISINELENAGNIDGALQLFNLFSKRYHWEPNDELTQELKSFLHRKY